MTPTLQERVTLLLQEHLHQLMRGHAPTEYLGFHAAEESRLVAALVSLATTVAQQQREADAMVAATDPPTLLELNGITSADATSKERANWCGWCAEAARHSVADAIRAAPLVTEEPT